LLAFTLPYSYLVGGVPYPFDLATIARLPGNYGVVKTILHGAFGTTLRQRAQPLLDWAHQQNSRSQLSRLVLEEAPSTIAHHPSAPLRERLERRLTRSMLSKLAAAGLLLSAFSLVFRVMLKEHTVRSPRRK